MKRISVLLVLAFFQLQVEACESSSISIKNNFPSATSAALLKQCAINQESNHITVHIQPENTPINNSPWYAFQVVSEQKQTVTMTINVENGTQRYEPKISSDGKTWDKIDFSKSEQSIHFDLPLTKQTLWISAQEIINNQDYIDWGNALSTKQYIKHEVIGHSVQNRPIYKLSALNKNTNDWLVLLGRQHPPEITGALALFPFASSILSEDKLASTFRERFNILIIPNMNPDGVELGYWRHNANGIDLNRDWKTLNQPEVKAVDSLLKKITASGGKIAMAVDFHSTHQDIFYTMPNNYGVEQRYLVNNWLGTLDKQLPDFNVIEKPGNNPNAGVFKQYIADTYKVHAITYEMGDHTDRQFIEALAIDAANTLMSTMLKDNTTKRH
ncbi:M14 family metallopeptidase [Thalassotalea fusca]